MFWLEQQTLNLWKNVNSAAVIPVKLITGDSNDALKSVYAAKIHIGTGGRILAQESIQMHGGMGVTEEMEIGQYFKRLVLLDTFLGNSDYYLNLYSSLE